MVVAPKKWQDAILTSSEALLVIDEIQKIPNWPTTIKKLWDKQNKDKNSAIQLVLLGSSSLQIQDGLHESLTGRFQLVRATHWDLSISKKLANLETNTFILFGGYPGSYPLLKRKSAWEKYVRDSIIETVIGKDILHAARVAKPAHFRQAFNILMSYPAQEISYTKLLGQIQDSGNTDLVKHYIHLYESAFLMKAIHKYSGRPLATRVSSPKLIPLCGALIDRKILDSAEGFGRAFEAAVGAALINSGLEVYYWREGNAEVDFVISHKKYLFAMEVKSGRKKPTKGIETFAKHFKSAIPVFVTEGNVEKLLTNPIGFLDKLV